MKRTKIIILIIIFLLSILSNTIICFASSEDVYYIDNMPLAVILSDDYLVLTRNMDSNAIRNFQKNGVTIDQINGLKQNLLTSDIYLYAHYLEDDSFDMLFNIESSDTYTMDFNNVTDEFLDFMYEQLLPTYTNYGMTVGEYEILKTAQTKYMKMYVEYQGEPTYNYMTVFNRNMLTITVKIYNTSRTNKIKQTVENILLNSLFIGDEANAYANSQRISYTESDTGTVFLLPKGWDAVQEKSDDMLKEIFKPTKNNIGNTFVHHNVIDMFKEMSKDELIEFINSGKTRKDYDLDYAKSKADSAALASLLGQEEGSIQEKSFNGIDYYCIETVDESKVLNIIQKQANCVYITIANGYLHIFIYSSNCNKNISDISEVDLSELNEFMTGIEYVTK